MIHSTERQNVVLDASAAVLLLEGAVSAGRIRDALGNACLMAPVVFPFEVTNVIRRHLSARLLSDDAARVAWMGLAELNVELWQWATIADRVWQLRGSITSYDASYIALSELMACPLVTADAKLAAMAPATCQIELV